MTAKDLIEKLSQVDPDTEVIDNYINDILYGKTSFPRFNLSEHAGVCTGGAALMHPANVFIDELTDRPICIDCIVKFI